MSQLSKTWSALDPPPAAFSRHPTGTFDLNRTNAASCTAALIPAPNQPPHSPRRLATVSPAGQMAQGAWLGGDA